MDYLSNRCKCKHRDDCECRCDHRAKCKERPYHRCEFCQAAFYLLNRLVNHYKDHVESFRKVTAEAKAEARRDFGVENDGEIQRLVKKQVQSQREKNGQFEANRLAAIQRA